ncbi:MAG TPA: hypothetical protein VF183_08795 [Acidimicrobiales bacterium]
MRRALLVLVAAIVLSLPFAAPALAQDDPEQPASQPGTTQVESGDESPSARAPSIVPRPDERGRNNFGGIVVAVVLVGGWAAFGAVMFTRARRRREPRHA